MDPELNPRSVRDLIIEELAEARLNHVVDVIGGDFHFGHTFVRVGEDRAWIARPSPPGDSYTDTVEVHTLDRLRAEVFRRLRA